jgi:hypothetical protein
MLTAQELADRLKPPVRCPIATFAQDCDPEYLQPLDDLVFSNLVGRRRAAAILKELGIEGSQWTIQRHRIEGCQSCQGWR